MNMKDFYKEHYFNEINRKQELTNALTIPLGVLVIIGGMAAFFARDFEFKSNINSFIFAELLAVATIFIVRTIYFLISSYHNYKYNYLPDPLDLQDYHKSLIEYHVSLGGKVEDADKEFEDVIVKKYNNCTHINTWNNDSKSEFLHKANESLIYSLVLILLCVVPYLVHYYSKPDKIQKIEIITSQNPSK